MNAEEHVALLTGYIDKTIHSLEHKAITRTTWRIEDLVDILLDIRNEVQALSAPWEEIVASGV